MQCDHQHAWCKLFIYSFIAAACSQKTRLLLYNYRYVLSFDLIITGQVSIVSMEIQKASGFLKNAYYQGHGRYVNQIMRLTLKFCKSAGSSREVRKFIETRLVDTARKNPGCVIYIKPRLFRSPVLKAEYIGGNYHGLSLHGMSCSEVEDWIQYHLTRCGRELYRLHAPTSSSKPSVQGVWTPFYFRDPSLINTELPNEELGRCISSRKSATEQLVELAKEHGFKNVESDEEQRRCQ